MQHLYFEGRSSVHVCTCERLHVEYQKNGVHLLADDVLFMLKILRIVLVFHSCCGMYLTFCC